MTGTGTGVGKTVVAASIVAALAGVRTEETTPMLSGSFTDLTGRSRHSVAAFKPVVTGLDETVESEWPADHELLARATGWMNADEVTFKTYGPAVSPHLAAELARETIERAPLLRAAQVIADQAETFVCEGVGGLLVPLNRRYSVLDFATDLALPVVVVANPGLGTISDTRLTVDRLRSANLKVAGVVLNPWPSRPDEIMRSNRDTIADICDLDVALMPVTAPDAIAAAGASLPIDAWL